jgi:acetyltransferase-like isoleucine patch superfamily enzyme
MHRILLTALAAGIVAAPGAAGAASPVNPIPSLSLGSAPSFEGSPAAQKPIKGVPRSYQNPFMATNGVSEIHQDAWQTDTYRWSGPLGRQPQTFSTLIGRDCGTITFDARGRLVSICVGATGPELYMFDPDTLETLATFNLPPRQPSQLLNNPNLFQDFTGGGYFYLDNQDRVVTTTTTRHIYVIAETADGTGFTLARDHDLSNVLTQGEALNSVLPDSSGRLWFVAVHDGVVGTIDPTSGAVHVIRLGSGTDGQITKSFATDQHDGVYIVNNQYMYRFGAGAGGVPRVVWRAPYPNSGEHKPGQLDAGSGTTPTVLPGGYVTIADNADPLDVVVYRTAVHPVRIVRRHHRRHRIKLRRQVCRVPVFGKGASATENSLIGAGRSIIVENNYGYQTPLDVALGKLTAPGVARVDINKRGTGCKLVWTNTTVHAPSVVPAISLTNGLIYEYTKDPGTSDPWYWTAVDFRNGQTVFEQLAGTGFLLPNNNYAGIAISPGGTAYVGTIGGVEAFR